MKIKPSIIILLSLGIFFLTAAPVFAEDINNPFPIPGRIQGTGTFFEIKDSEYLNISLESNQEIKVVLESIPKMIVLDVAAAEGNVGIVTLILKGLQPDKTYYEYQNSYKNEAVFITDENGNFTWTQDLSETSHIWIQEQESTTYIEENTTLDADIIGSVEISVSGITLDCNGHNIIGDGSAYGIYIYNKTNTTVKNCNVNGFSYGVLLYGNASLYNTISNNNIFANEYGGLKIQSISWTPQSSNNYVFNNQIYSNIYQGVELYGTNTNQIIGNSVSNNGGIGLLLNWAPSNYLRNNTITNNDYNFGVYGGWVSGAQDIDISNTVNGKPIYYLVNADTITIDVSLNPGYIGVVNSENIIIRDVTISDNVQGIYLENTTHSRIENTHLTNNLMGIEMNKDSNNEIIGNELLQNSWDGARLWVSSYNIFIDNDISSNGIGTELTAYEGAYSHDNKIYHNNFKNNQGHISMDRAYDNLFNDNYPSGGNYWSGYIGIDEKSSPNQDQPGSDGIGDTPYAFYNGQDRYPFMEESGWKAPQKWSFAIITDIHAGQGSLFLDYGNLGWNDDNTGQEPTKATENLRDIVSVINLNKDKYNIAFVVVDGDFTNSAELSEMNKAKEILDTLEIPWIPLIGNHDVWPYTMLSEAPEYSGDPTDKYFNDVFNSQYEELKNIFQNWEKASIPVWNSETDPNHFSFFQNFAFDFNEYHFIGLDFNYRDDAIWGRGVKPEGKLYEASWDWFTSHLQQYINQHIDDKENIVLFSHHSFRKWKDRLIEMGFSEDELNTIDNFLENYKDKIAFQFAGHSHDKNVKNFKDVMTMIETQANVEGPVARIVQIYPDGKIDYSQLLPEKMMIVEGHSPIDLEITDPDGLRINKQINEIPGAGYFEEDTDEDEELDDTIQIPERKMGNYQIRVIPEPGAAPDDTYTLEVSVLESTLGYVPILLAEDIPISETPTEPYLFELKEREATQISYTGELSGQYSNQVNLSAVLTDIDGNPLTNKPVIFEIGEQSISAITDDSGVASAVMVLNQIPGQYYYVEANFNGDEDYLPAFDSDDFVIKSAKEIKQDAIIKLEQAKTGDKKYDKEIDKIIWLINQSLNESLWLDDSHLVFFEKGNCANLNLEKLLDKDELDLDGIGLKCLKSGIVVFYFERMAVKLMVPKPALKPIIEELIRADKTLAQVSLFDAKNTPIKTPKLQKIIENQIKKAEQEIGKAEKELEKNRPDKAILRLAKSWLHSQLAIKFANL